MNKLFEDYMSKYDGEVSKLDLDDEIILPDFITAKSLMMSLEYDIKYLKEAGLDEYLTGGILGQNARKSEGIDRMNAAAHTLVADAIRFWALTERIRANNPQTDNDDLSAFMPSTPTV